MFITLWVTVLSLLALLALEKLAKRIYGTSLVRWQRWLLPVPMMAFLAANLDGVHSLGAWLETHPGHFAIRYAGNSAWDTLRFAYPGMLGLLFIPCLQKSSFLRVAHFSILWWFFHLLWLFFVLFPLGLATGVPLRD